MAFEGLVTELKRLIKNRVSGSQAKESIESFANAMFLLELRFFSSSRTFGSKIGKEHEGGQTIVCGLKGHDLQVAVMMLSSSNDWVKDLAKEEEFELWGRLVSYDTLYDRAIFEHALEEDPKEQPYSVPEPISEQPQAVLPKKSSPPQPREVNKRDVRRRKRVKLPKKAKNRRASERKLYRKSSDVAAPGRDKRMFWGKPRKLKIVKRPGSSSKGVGHAVLSKKPLKRTLRSAPKANQRRSVHQAPQFRVSRAAVSPVPNPAHIVRILQKKKEHGIMALTLQEKQALQRAGLGGAGKDSLDGFHIGMGCLMAVGIVLVLLSMPFCASSGAKGFGTMCFWLGFAMCIPHLARVLKS
jgi:hypothetical protein